MPAPTVAFELYDAVFQYMEQLGHSEHTLCDKLNVKSKFDYNHNGRIPLLLYEQAFIAGENLTDDPAFGIAWPLEPRGLSPKDLSYGPFDA